MSYPWSSLGYYVAAPAHRLGWLRVDWLLGKNGIPADTAAGRQDFERHLEARRRAEANDEEWAPIRRGWCLGRESFRQELLKQIDGTLGDHQVGRLRQENAEARAERIMTPLT